MSITFTNTQLKATSKDILLLPFVINDPVTGYVGQKAALQTQSDVELADDTNKENFYNFWKSTILHYHNELDFLNSSRRTDYSDTDLNAGGNQTGNHYPNVVNLWLAPKLLSSMNGNPVVTSATVNETTNISEVTKYINYLKNGFSDGVASSSINAITSTDFNIVTGTPPAINNRVYLHNGTNSIFGVVTGVVGSLVSYTMLGGVLFSSGTCDISLAGFTNTERSHASVAVGHDVQVYFENQLSAAVTNWATNLTGQKLNLDNNGDYAPRKAHVLSAAANIFSLQLIISGWQGLAYNSRYIDSGLLLLQNAITTRTSQIAARITEIGTDLGAVTQDGTGAFSGTGAYFELTKIINIRISRSGSLCTYISSFIGLAYFDKIISDANDQLAGYQQTMVVKKITQDVSISDNVVKVDSTSQLSIGDSVKLFDNDSNVYSRVINGISGLNVTLDLAMVAVLATAKLARLTKEL